MCFNELQGVQCSVYCYRMRSCAESSEDDEPTKLSIEKGEYTSSNDTEPSSYPKDEAELLKLRKNIAMELLWVQQAINSRKNYLTLKAGMD
ncbi:IQ domain-containing protein C-like [Gigantopelta aegis]|uniref:IQ domain-containing protein C-like n=1 Tax=Gigantopelta aegis TaxID=1735272 RepID=UPI001B88BFF7|nr:IQ domain-containing protein C-like [Gigantopelta aegis]